MNTDVAGRVRNVERPTSKPLLRFRFNVYRFRCAVVTRSQKMGIVVTERYKVDLEAALQLSGFERGKGTIRLVSSVVSWGSLR